MAQTPVAGFLLHAIQSDLSPSSLFPSHLGSSEQSQMFGKNKRRNRIHHVMDAQVAEELNAAIVVEKILGRTNYVHLAMLPKGEWPKWCRTCGGSGLGYCSRCFVAGDNRFVLALPFMKRASNDFRDPKKYKVGDKSGLQTAADFLSNGQ